MIISGIYMIQSKIKSERIYIGSTENINRRWDCHLRDLKKNKHGSKKLQNHYNKYGKNDFIFSIIIGCDKEDLIITEQFYLDAYNPYFNECKIAGNTSGFRFSDESKKKMSKAWENREPISDETRKKMSKSHKDKHWKLSEITKQKLSESAKRKIITAEHRRKLNESHKGLISSGTFKKGDIPWNKGLKKLQLNLN